MPFTVQAQINEQGTCDGYTLSGNERGSLIESVLGVLGRILVDGETTEHGGFILDIDGKYWSSVPESQGSRSEVDYCIPIFPNGGARLVAVYHTHPEIPLFSEGDKGVARRWGVPSFIATMRKAEGYHLLSTFDPITGDTKLLGTMVIDGSELEFHPYE